MAGQQTAAKAKEWLVLVYMAGDNNLDAAGLNDLAEMKEVGSTTDLDVVVQFDRAGSNGTTKRYHVKAGGTLEDDVVGDLGETNCGDPKVLRAFVEWGCATFPARNRLLVIWNHGAGWDDSNLYAGQAFGDAPPPVTRKQRVIAHPESSAAAVPASQLRAALGRNKTALFRNTPVEAMQKAIAFDDQAKDFLDNGEVQRALTGAAGSGRKLDLIGMDACLMSMAEVLFQLKDTAHVFVAAQETEPNDGWPYDRILRALAGRPTLTPAELGVVIVDQYVASYVGSREVTLAAVGAEKMEKVAAALDALARSLLPLVGAKETLKTLVAARGQVQSYSPPYADYCDLADLCTLLEGGCTQPDVQAACKAAKAAVSGAVLASKTSGASVANSHGLSVYFPTKKLSTLYAGLDIAKATAWPKFLGAYLEAMPRR